MPGGGDPLGGDIHAMDNRIGNLLPGETEGMVTVQGVQGEDGREYGGVDCNLIVDQSSDDLLDKVDRFGGKAGRRVVSFCVLYTGTKYRAGRFQECRASWEQAGARC